MKNHEKLKAYAILVILMEGGGYEAHYPILRRKVIGYGPTPTSAVYDLTDRAAPEYLLLVRGTELPDPPRTTDEFDIAEVTLLRALKEAWS